jgi:hypothetical protein
MIAKSLRFITLTLKHGVGPLKTQIDRLGTCFTRLRHRKLWQSAVGGGASFVEIKRSKDGRHWHPHLHIVVEGRYLAQSALSADWLAVTGDSYVVDIRMIRDAAKVGSYVVKYASKPLDRSLYANPDWLDEAMIALRGRRLVATFGSWSHLALTAAGDDPGDWEFVATLDDVVEEPAVIHEILRSAPRTDADPP